MNRDSVRGVASWLESLLRQFDSNHFKLNTSAQSISMQTQKHAQLKITAFDVFRGWEIFY